MGQRELKKHKLLPNPKSTEEHADGKKVREMEDEEQQKKRTTKKKNKSKTKNTMGKMRIGSMHGKDSVRWKPLLMHL